MSTYIYDIVLEINESGYRHEMMNLKMRAKNSDEALDKILAKWKRSVLPYTMSVDYVIVYSLKDPDFWEQYYIGVKEGKDEDQD